MRTAFPVKLLAAMALAIPVSIAGCKEPSTPDTVEFAQTRQLAEQGNAKAQNSLGIMYYNGENVPQNYTEAMRWWRRAAEQDNAKAQYNIGLMYFLQPRRVAE